MRRRTGKQQMETSKEQWMSPQRNECSVKSFAQAIHFSSQVQKLSDNVNTQVEPNCSFVDLRESKCPRSWNEHQMINLKRIGEIWLIANYAQDDDSQKNIQLLKTPVSVVFCLWTVELTRVVRKIPHFGVGVVWGTIPSGLPVFWVIVPGCSWNGYGTSPNLWVQKKLVKFWQGTQDTWLCFAKFLREFLSHSHFDLLRDLRDVILSRFRVKCVLCSTTSAAIGRFSRNCC